MELIILILGASALAGCLGGSLYIYDRVQRRTFQENERLLALWKRLAASSDHLEFVPGRYKLPGSQNSCITGTYRGHRLTLDTFYRGETNSSASLEYLLKPSLRTAWMASGGTEIYIRLVMTLGPNRQLAVEHAEQPLTRKEILSLLTSPTLSWFKASIQTRAEGREITYEQPGIETDLNYLQQVLDALSDRAEAHLKILRMGAEAIAPLREIVEMTTDPNLRTCSQQLIRGIATQNRQTLGGQLTKLVCPRCLTRFRAYDIDVSWLEKVTYYGCRSCGQSREHLSGQVFAVLDRQMADELVERHNIVRVNWLARRSLFDFDAVAIAQATDEEVERFAVQVGNDTDTTRQGRYRHMRCVVSDGSNLSQNSLKILNRTFGSVEIIPSQPARPTTPPAQSPAESGDF